MVTETASASVPRIKVPPHVWGRAFWVAMHSVSFTYPDTPSRDDREQAKAFLNSISHLLPCKACCAHFRDQLRTVDIERVVGSRDEFVKFLVHVHNEVNRSAGKRVMTLSEVIEEYKREEGEQQCPMYATTTQTLMGHTCSVQPIVTVGVVVAIVAAVALVGAGGYLWYRRRSHGRRR
jgi:Fe-S-cluster containining protein